MVATHPAQGDATANQTTSRRNGRFGMRTSEPLRSTRERLRSQFTASPPHQHNDKGSSLMNPSRTRPHAPRARTLSLPLALLLTAVSGSALADYPPARQTPIGAPGRSIAANDQSSAIALNPANLGFLTTSEVRWTWVRTSEDSRIPARGHAFDFALALPWRVGTGLRLDFVRPGGLWPNYTWLTWGLGVA